MSRQAGPVEWVWGGPLGVRMDFRTNQNKKATKCTFRVLITERVSACREKTEGMQRRRGDPERKEVGQTRGRTQWLADLIRELRDPAREVPDRIRELPELSWPPPEAHLLTIAHTAPHRTVACSVPTGSSRGLQASGGYPTLLTRDRVLPFLNSAREHQELSCHDVKSAPCRLQRARTYCLGIPAPTMRNDINKLLQGTSDPHRQSRQILHGRILPNGTQKYVTPGR